MTKSNEEILILCNLDTRDKEIAFVKDLIQERGDRGLFLDLGMEVQKTV